jgi:hypothetical protein
MNYVLVIEGKFPWDFYINFFYCCKLKAINHEAYESPKRCWMLRWLGS